MSIWQRRLADSPEERVSERLRDAERGIAAKARNSQVPAMQRGTVLPFNTGVVTASVMIAQIPLQIPSGSAGILMSWSGASSTSALGNSGQLSLLEATDFPGAGIVLVTWTGFPAPSIWSGGAETQGGGNVTYRAVSSWTNPYDFQTTGQPTPGLRTYQMYAQRTVGAGSVGINNFTWSMLVI